MTFRLTNASTSQSCAFSIKRSEDRKTVTLESFSHDDLLNNTVEITLPTMPDSTAYVHTEDERETAFNDSNVNKIIVADIFEIRYVLTLSNRAVEIIDGVGPAIGGINMWSSLSEPAIILENSGDSNNPTKMQCVSVLVTAINSTITNNSGAYSYELEDSKASIYADDSGYNNHTKTIKMDFDSASKCTSILTYYCKLININVTASKESSQFVIASGIENPYVKSYDTAKGHWVWTLTE